MKVYARCKTIHDENCGRVPYNYNIANAIYGFHEMGFEIHLYDRVDEIYDLLEKGDIVLDGIKQVEYCLNKFGIVPQNQCIVPQMENYGYYPAVLQPYLGRKVWKDTINHINATPELWGNFVKPVKEKVFTGKVIRSAEDLIGCGSCYEDYEVICSEPVDFVFECRGFVYYDKMIDLRPYRGDFVHMKDMDTELIQKAVFEYVAQATRPNACALDWGLTKDGRTLLVEQNLFYACGCYGLNHIDYAKMISACISQMYGIPDECLF